MTDKPRVAAPVYFGDRLVGIFEKLADQGRLRFTYDESWRNEPGTFPISLSMPETQPSHTDQHRHNQRPVANFLWGLLPDNDDTITRWAAQFGVGRKAPLALLCEIGADCPGGISFVQPAGEASVTLLAGPDIAREMRRLQEAVPSQLDGNHGHFSLAGAQTKTVLRQTTDGWAIPHGATPSTHILKPTMIGLIDQAVNEHFCLELARRVGLPAAESQVTYFDDVPVLVVKRFDRFGDGKTMIRLHQEDMCQALGVHPRDKYEADGGPRARRSDGAARHVFGRCIYRSATTVPRRYLQSADCRYRRAREEFRYPISADGRPA